MSNQGRQLFGTDGIRGVAGEFPLTLDSTYLIGRALGHDVMRASRTPQVVLGQDTRESSGWIGRTQRGRDYDARGCVPGAIAGHGGGSGDFGVA
jgi:hypothetical protein